MSITAQRADSAMDVNRFQIRTTKGLKQFLRAIHPGFLAYVDPRHSRLLDIMIQNELLTDSDQESLSGKGVYVRRDQARKLWFSLHKMRVQDFTCTVLPELCSNFPHILPEEWIDSNEDGPDEEYCFRHDITDKIRPATMADLLFDCHCLGLEDYKDLSETNINEEVIWEALFEAVRRRNTGDAEQAMRGLLNKRKVDVPNNFLDLLSSGIPCTCHRSEQRMLTSIPPATPKEKIAKWFMMSHSKGGSTVHSDVCTTVDGLSIAERDTDSLFGGGEGSFFSQKPTRAKPPLPKFFRIEQGIEAEVARRLQEVVKKDFWRKTQEQMSMETELLMKEIERERQRWIEEEEQMRCELEDQLHTHIKEQQDNAKKLQEEFDHIQREFEDKERMMREKEHQMSERRRRERKRKRKRKQ